MTTDFAEMIQELHRGTWDEAVGLVIETATRDGVEARLEIRPEHRQPMGLVHGGVLASVVESLASVGAATDTMAREKRIVGLENHTSFVRAAREGTLRASATPVTRGRRSQLWEVIIRDAGGATVATGRVRLLVLDRDAQVAGDVLALDLPER